MDMKKVGKAIAMLRRQSGLTQRALAERLGVSDKAVSKWERGVGLPDIGYLRKLAILLDTDTDSLLAGGAFQHDSDWVGILILPQEQCCVNVGTVIYDKPLIDYLLSYFLLVGIQEIVILCDKNNRSIIEERFFKANPAGFRVRCVEDESACQANCSNFRNSMIVKGNLLLYSVDMTNFFQRAMSKKQSITGIAVPVGNNRALRKVVFDDQRRVCPPPAEDCGICTSLGYYYDAVPVYFSPVERCAEIITGEICDPYYVEPVNRGFVAFEIINWDDLATASEFIRLTQAMTGLAIGDLNEIVRRRCMKDIT